MIVTCESCKSRYKLDDAKITGKGAKITCPKCKSVFVVYARDPGAPARPAAPVAPPSPALPAAVGPALPVAAAARAEAAAGDDEWEDEPTRVGESSIEGHEVMRARSPSTPNMAGAPVPPPSAPGPGSAPAPAPSFPKDSAELATRAASLDFRKVGVSTWKVKVKIGLIYDFSDIKTLRKYIQDGRVTAADVVSWDGKSWRAIGDIPDLDAFFVETWEMLDAQRAAAPPPAPAPPAPVAAVEDPPAPPRTGGEPQQFADPFAELRRKQQEKGDTKRTAAPPPTPPRPERKPASPVPKYAVGLGILLAAAAGAWWWSTQLSGLEQVAAPPPAAPSAPPQGEDIRARLEQDIKNSIQNGAGEAPPPAPDPDEKIPVRPSDRGELVPVNAPGPGGKKPAGATAGAPAARDATAADHEEAGDAAADAGQWSQAVKAYRNAVSLDGKNGPLVLKLGRAQFETGDGAAETTLLRAAKLGARGAYRYLGDIKAKNGDTAGAVADYQQYLKTSPPDAAEIEQKITALTGG